MKNLNFLPDGYQVPQSNGGSYMKLQAGENRFRIIGNLITGWQCWIDDNGVRKPLRYRERPSVLPTGADKLKHFWAFCVIHDSELKILELTQAGILEAITELVKSADWGDRRNYDLVITRKGSGLETTYQVRPNPIKPLDDYQKAIVDNELGKINLAALYDNNNPFEGGDLSF